MRAAQMRPEELYSLKVVMITQPEKLSTRLIKCVSRRIVLDMIFSCVSDNHKLITFIHSQGVYSFFWHKATLQF